MTALARREFQSQESLHKKACLLINDGLYEEALGILERIAATPDALNDRAVALHQMGRTAEALPLLEEALKARPDHMAALLNHRYMKLVIGAMSPVPARRVIEDWGPPPCPSPAVSVIIPTYNRPELLAESAASVLNQTHKDLELIVVSDGGPPAGEKILRNMGSDRIRYVLIEHGGISAALNAGLARARGRYVAYLDDDDIYYPNHIITLAEYLDSRPEADIVHTVSRRRIMAPEGDGWRTIAQTVIRAEPITREELLTGGCIETMGSVMHRRKVFEEVGGFHEGIMGCQDLEWYLKVSKDHAFHFINEITLEHRRRESPNSQLTANIRLMRHNVNIVLYLYRAVILTSRASERWGYQRALKIGGKLLTRYPEFFDLIRPMELARIKPYAHFLQLGKDLAGMGELDRARRAFFISFSLAPWEIKLIGYLLFPRSR